MYFNMNKEPQVRRVTANLPASLLKEACQVSGTGITETLVEGLTLIKRRAAAGKAAKLRGRLNLSIDLETSRERPRR
ncbi:MAG: hypothetical protein AB7T38_02935 [Nitrospirales bacterium]